MARDMTRRGVLTAGAAALPLMAAGCRGIAALGTPPKAAPDVALTRAAMAVEVQLIAQYDAALAALPALAGTLRPLLAQHHDHLARLRARLIIPAGHPLPTLSPGARARRGAPAPGTPTAALGQLRAAEDAASGALLAHLVTAPPSLAQLLASISASEATHALILRTAAGHP
jgi:hypothetical protein